VLVLVARIDAKARPCALRSMLGHQVLQLGGEDAAPAGHAAVRPIFASPRNCAARCTPARQSVHLAMTFWAVLLLLQQPSPRVTAIQARA